MGARGLKCRRHFFIKIYFYLTVLDKFLLLWQNITNIHIRRFFSETKRVQCSINGNRYNIISIFLFRYRRLLMNSARLLQLYFTLILSNVNNFSVYLALLCKICYIRYTKEQPPTKWLAYSWLKACLDCQVQCRLIYFRLLFLSMQVSSATKKCNQEVTAKNQQA